MLGVSNSQSPCPVCGGLCLENDLHCGSCSAALPRPERSRLTANGGLAAERRDLVVMFCDLVGSTEIASRLDPEDVLDLMHIYRSIVRDVVADFHGCLAQYYGDGAMVYFGWPAADETNAEQAVRAGLKIVETLRRRPAKGEVLDVRVGIASGLVVVGNVYEAGNQEEHAVVGETPNIAARIQNWAAPGTVVIDEQTRSRIGGLFEQQDLGEVPIRGYSKPIRVWRVLRESAVQNRFQALRSGEPGAMVGRDVEFEALFSLWRTTVQSDGRSALVSGEAGIGKSRLIAAFENALECEDVTRLSFYCAPHLGDTALHPVVAYLEHAIGLNRRDMSGQPMERLVRLMGPLEDSTQRVSLIAELLSVPIDESDRLELSPQARKQETFRVLLDWFESLAGRGPMMVLFEDLHWADPTTLELIQMLIDRMRRLPVLLVMTIRDEFRLLWRETDAIDRIVLNRLDPDSSAIIAKGLVGDGVEIPDSLVQRIVVQSDGNPLFVEELTKAVLEESRNLGQFGSVHLPEAVPSSLQASMMARLDRLPGAKRVAQIGAVIGREFANSILADVAELPTDELAQGLRSLVEVELLMQRSQGPDVIYSFKHALLRDAAYESLLHKDCRAIHARIVQVLKAHYPDLPDRQPGLLGHHCAHAGLIAEAADYFRCAGNISAQQAAMVETRNQLERGLELVATLPESPDRIILETELKLALGRVLLSTTGSADEEAGRILEEAVTLCQQQSDIDRSTRALWAFWFNSANRRELTVANKIARELMDLAIKKKSRPSRIVAHTMVGIARFWEGNFRDAESNLGAAVNLCRDNDHAKLDLAIVSRHLDVHAQMQFALALRCLGQYEAADGQGEEAQDKARRVAHLPTRALVLAAKCRSEWFARRNEKMEDTATELVEMAKKQGLPFYLALGRCHLGWLEVIQGRSDAGLRLLREGFQALQSGGAYIWQPYIRGMYAEAEIVSGDYQHAQRLLDGAMVLSEQTGGAWFDAELHRLRGELELVQFTPEIGRAQQHFESAISIAREQSARLWELRAATSLAKLHLARGDCTHGHAVLSPVRDWFPQKIDAKDVVAAAAVLEELSLRS